MRKFAGHIAAILTLFTYLIANVGFGVHVCSVEKTSTPVFFFNGNTSCEEIHLHHHDVAHYRTTGECHACHESHIHSAECCSTEILVITDAQEKKNLQHFSVITADVVIPKSDCGLQTFVRQSHPDYGHRSASYCSGQLLTGTALRL